jgi:membrane-associated protease RseP (regulator of RpoE activity)
MKRKRVVPMATLLFPGYTGVGPPPAAAATIGSLPPRSRSAHVATYWGTGQPVILGILMRQLNDQEKAQLMRNDGIVVELVGNNSPATAAHLQPGDIILALDGKPILDLKAMSPFLQSVAGRRIRVDLLRGGTSLTVEVQLNPAAH